MGPTHNDTVYGIRARMCAAMRSTPSMATIFFTLNNLVSSVHLSGFVQSYLEVGGADVSALMATVRDEPFLPCFERLAQGPHHVSLIVEL
eukprot:SAG11_NODE_3851_length_2190_cov_5.705404_3_plen_90_part_00